MSWEQIVAFAALFCTVVGGVMRMMRTAQTDKEEVIAHIDVKDKETRGQLMLAVDRSRTEFGETVKAIKQHSMDAHDRVDRLIIKHQELELYIRDNYVEVESFDKALGRVERTVDGIDEKVDKLMQRIPSRG